MATRKQERPTPRAKRKRKAQTAPKQPKLPPYLPLGRPRSIGQTEYLVVYDTLARGGSLRDAADLLEVNYSTLRRAIKADALFAGGIKKATAYGKLVLLDAVRASKPGWQSRAWMLERKWWKEFRKRDNHRDDNPASGERINADALSTADPTLVSLTPPPGAVPPVAGPAEVQNDPRWATVGQDGAGQAQGSAEPVGLPDPPAAVDGSEIRPLGTDP